MRTYEELFNKGLQQFIDENEGIYRKICKEASIHSSIIGTSQEILIDDQIKKAFINHLHTRYGNNTDIFTTVVMLMASDELERVKILTEHYTEIADTLGISLNDFLVLNNISI